MVVLIPLVLSIVPVVLGATITVFEVQLENDTLLPEDATYEVLGTNTNGAISLLKQIPVTEIVEFTTVDGSPVPTTVPTSFVAEETYLISSGGYARFVDLTADIGAINVLEACTYGSGGDARCIQEAWAATGGPTQTLEYTGTIVPVYTLTVDESPSQSSASSTSPSSTATSPSATSLTSSGTESAPPQVTDGGDTSDDTDASVGLFSRGLGPALAAGVFLTMIMFIRFGSSICHQPSSWLGFMYAAMSERPMMRRKSSAQNLLSSFKPANINTSGVPMTPTLSTPMEPPDTAVPQGTSVEYLRDLVQKRILTLTYMRNMHEGQSHWFHTIFLSKGDLEREFNNIEMRKRTSRFTVLGMSLSALLDINHPPDFLRGLLNTLIEWDQAKEENTTNSKLRQAPRKLFRNRGKRPAEFYLDAAGGDSSYLITPHIPFQLDYHHTLLALLDVLSEVYAKLARMLGPSPFPRMNGPLGPLSPHPGVSDLLDPGDDLFTIANASSSMPSAAYAAPASLDADAILKIDAKLRKITGTLLKELDHLARKVIKDELASLDPRLDFEAGGM